MASLGLPQSDDTILRSLKRRVVARDEPAKVRVVGIDDWAWQKGLRYGTIMVDLERREVIDVLPDRSAEATGRWLGQHPGVEIVSRDRCGLYAEGARRGAPQAEQVADRFHLLQNLRQTIEQQLTRASRPARPSSLASAAAEAVITAASTDHGRQPALAEHRRLVSTGRMARFTDMFNRVKALQSAGDGVLAIVRQTKFHWRTVTKWMRLEELPERNVMAPKSNTPSAFRDHLARRWAEGCTSGRALLLEIRDLGFTGSLSHLGRLLAGWRRAGRPVTVDDTAAAAPLLIDPSTGHLVSPIVAAALCVKPRGLPADEIRQIFRLVKSVADLPNVIHLLIFDRDIAERAFDDPANDLGPKWHEKIVQAAFDLPPVQRVDIQQLFLEGLNKLIGEMEVPDKTRWGNVFHDGIAPWLRTPRDAGRLLNSLVVTWPAVAPAMSILRTSLLSTLRLFEPGLHAFIRHNPQRLTGLSGDHARDEGAKASLGKEILDTIEPAVTRERRPP